MSSREIGLIIIRSMLERARRKYNLAETTVAYLWTGLLDYWTNIHGKSRLYEFIQAASRLDNFVDGNTIGYRSLLEKTKIITANPCISFEENIYNNENSLIIFAAADSAYANKYAGNMVNSALEHGFDVHLHIVSDESLLGTLGVMSKNIEISYSFKSADNLLALRRREYYAFVRFLIIDEIYLHYKSPVIITDIDAKIVRHPKDVGDCKCDIALNIRSKEDLNFPWNEVTAGCVCVFTEKGALTLASFARSYWASLSDSIKKFDNIWWCDQNMLYKFIELYRNQLVIETLELTLGQIIKYETN